MDHSHAVGIGSLTSFASDYLAVFDSSAFKPWESS